MLEILDTLSEFELSRIKEYQTVGDSENERTWPIEQLKY